MLILLFGVNMKRYFILAIFLFSFLFTSGMLKVKALDEVIYDLEPGYKQFKEQDYNIVFGGVTLDNVESAMKELNKVLSENNINYIMTVDFNGSYGKYKFSDITIYEYSNSITNFTAVKNSDDTGVTFRSDSDFLKYLRVKGQTAYQNGKEMTPILQSLIEYIKQNKRLPSSSSEFPNATIGSFPGFLTYFYTDSINGSIIYNSNMSINFSKMTRVDGFKLGNTIYKENSIFPTYIDTIGYGYEKKVYTEDFRIASKNIDRVEYSFDLENKSNIIHEFNFSATWFSSIARSKLFGSPYLQYKKDGVIYKLPMNEVCTAILDEYSYCDTQINNFIDIQELKFVVDFNNINNLNNESDVLIHFDSSLNFNCNVIYIDDENSNFSNYVEVDFTNKYGVLLIPKLIYGDYNQQVYSDLYYLGKGLKINLYDSIDTTKEPIHSENGVYSVGNMWGKFEYLFKFNNYNQYLFFLNKNYLIDDEITKIRYDKRYFVHSICSSSDSCEKVVNPNTNEEIEIKPPDINDDSISDNSLFSMFHFFEKPIKFIFDGIGILYNDYALPIVQKYWYFGFGFTVFIIVLKLFF